ncbi:MAG TPA: TolC family protein [Aquificales bacterium]|uniref:TolC family protein n=1 Tax=Aquifex aeolicus TaxID=63363 RepID=A0A9D0YNV9_AQUAO|nr:TolC family protein [Aquificales bacterium]HIP97966.1 TolC family protein [Aquifex aeolicus]
MFKKTLLLTPFLGFGLSLEEAVQIALSNNPKVKAQLYRYKGAKEEFKSAIAQRLGEVSLFWRYTQYKFPRVVAPISPPVNPANFRGDDQIRIYGLRYKVRLFDACGQFFTILAKRDTARLYSLLAEDSAKETAKEVKKAYFKILALKERLKAFLLRKREVEKLYQIVKNAYELGKRPLLDLLKVKAKLWEVNSKLSQLSAQLERTKNKLRVLLNTDKPLEVDEVKVTPKKFGEEQFIGLLLKNNPKLKEVAAQRKIAEDYKRVALSHFAPTVDFTYSTQKYVYAGKSSSDWSFTVNVNFPIMDFGKRFFEYRLARYEERKREELLKFTEREVLENYKSLVETLNAMVDTIKANERRLEFAEEAYRVEKEKYITGRGKIYSLLKAQAEYYQALGEYKAGIYEWASLKAELDYLLGF